MLRFLTLVWALAPSPSHADIKQACTDKVIASLRATLIIGEENSIRASACKLWLGDKSKMLTVIAYEPPKYPESTNYELPFHIAMLNASTLKILSHYKGSVSEDAVTHVNESSLQLDTARYFLTKDIRAFGLRVQANVEPRFSEGGTDDYLSLYVFEGKEIRPVLTGLPMRRWVYVGDIPGIYEGIPADGTTDNHTTKVTNFTLNIAQTTSHGFADLLIIAKTSGRKKILTHRLRYDGKSYPFEFKYLDKLSGSE